MTPQIQIQGDEMRAKKKLRFELISDGKKWSVRETIKNYSYRFLYQDDSGFIQDCPIPHDCVWTDKSTAEKLLNRLRFCE